jgi:diadenosine tetraphosphate (Ap4A) HIT family hydrolase
MPVGDEPTSLVRSAEQCLVPRRHVLGLQELEGVEAALIGRLLWAASRALIAVTGCEKTYVLLLAEQESFTHVHFHIVPRHRDLDPSMRGARIFGYLGNRKDAPGPADDKLAAKLGAEVEAALAD